jgi:hypothetical protein
METLVAHKYVQYGIIFHWKNFNRVEGTHAVHPEAHFLGLDGSIGLQRTDMPGVEAIAYCKRGQEA